MGDAQGPPRTRGTAHARRPDGALVPRRVRPAAPQRAARWRRPRRPARPGHPPAALPVRPGPRAGRPRRAPARPGAVAARPRRRSPRPREPAARTGRDAPGLDGAAVRRAGGRGDVVRGARGLRERGGDLRAGSGGRLARRAAGRARRPVHRGRDGRRRHLPDQYRAHRPAARTFAPVPGGRAGHRPDGPPGLAVRHRRGGRRTVGERRVHRRAHARRGRPRVAGGPRPARPAGGHDRSGPPGGPLAGPGRTGQARFGA
jgi:hypothetical protein